MEPDQRQSIFPACASPRNTLCGIADPRRRPISVKINGAFSSNSALVLRKAARAGLGIGYLPRYCIEEDLKAGASRKVLPNYSPPQRPIYVVYPPAARVPERVRTFVDFLAQWFANSRAAKSDQKAQKRDFRRVRCQSTLRPISTY